MIEHQRGRALGIGGFGEHTGPNGDRMQQGSDSSALVEHPDNMDCLVLLVAAAVYAATWVSTKTKEHLVRGWRGATRCQWYLRMLRDVVHAKRGVVRSGVGECAIAVVLKFPTSSGRYPLSAKAI